jgi:hypothetical protein
VSEDVVLVQLEDAVQHWDEFVDAVLVQAELAVERERAEWLRQQRRESASH